MKAKHQEAVAELTAALNRTFQDLWPSMKAQYGLDGEFLRVAVLSAGAHFIADIAQQQSQLTDQAKARLIQRIDEVIADTIPLE